MKGTKIIRDKWLNIRVNDDEYKKIEDFSNNSTCNTISEYSRSILLKKPVIIKFRNQSADEILAAVIQLKNELNAIGNNFNQVVHRLHTLDRISEIKAWLSTGETSRQIFMHKVEEIKQSMIQIYKIWSQK